MDEKLEKSPVRDPFLLNAVTLAYIGDAVFELKAREYMLERGFRQAHILHEKVTGLVNAMSQSDMAVELQSELSEEELSVFRRARNSHKMSKARHRRPSDYRRATGIEAVFGYLFLSEETARLDRLFLKCVGIHDRKEEENVQHR